MSKYAIHWFAAAAALLALVAVQASANVNEVRQNLDKYWSYRQMQRTYFIHVGTGLGHSLPARWRCVPEHQMDWGDTTIDLGWYIGALATEHYMLTHPEIFPGYASGGGDLNTCRNELQLALAAMDRLDATAEDVLQPGFPDTPGFFIRDDVPADFYQHFPDMTHVISDYTNPEWFAKEMSQDQVCHVMLGLTLVKKLIPSDLVVNGMNLRAAAVQRGADIIDWVHQDGWIIKDPVFGTDVVRGEDARAYSKGYARAGAYLTDGAEDWSGTVSGFYSWVWDTLTSPTNPGYDNYNNRHMAMVIAAEGNGWGNSTLNALMSLADAYDWYAYPLLYAVLHDPIPQSQGTWLGHQATMNSIVQSQLNMAPASGPHEPITPEEENTGWCADQKFIRTLDNSNQGGATDGYQYAGLDYLVLHNLHYIVTPSLWQDPSPPAQATNPDPANGATGVSLGNPTLSWTAGSGATSHDVRFGSSNPPPFIQNQAETTYNPGSLNESATYYWRIDEKNSLGTTTGTVWSFTTAGVAPGPVTNLSVTQASQQVTLSWHTPSDSDFTGTMIRFKTTGYPTSPTDGTLVVNKSAAPNVDDSYTHTGLSNGVTYYYSAFAHDGVPNYSVKADIIATPSGYCFSESFPYLNGSFGGSGGWVGSCPSLTIWNNTCRIDGGEPACTVTNNNMSCIAAAAFTLRAQVKAGYGSDTMWAIWFNDASGNNIARWYGAGTTARGRIGGGFDVTDPQTLTGGWDNLEVLVNTVDDTSQFYFNGAPIGTLSHAGAGNSVGQVIIERMSNSSAVGHYMFLDNIEVQDADRVAPDAVTGFTGTAGINQVSLSWTNPTTSDFAGTVVRYRTDTYPTSATNGSFVCNRAASPGSSDSYVHTGINNGVTYYYSAFAYDEVPNYSAAAHTNGRPVGPREAFASSIFTLNTDGWMVSLWKADAGGTDGTMGWGGTYGRTGGGIRCTGGGITDDEQRCLREGGEMRKTISTVGYEKIQVSYDLRVNNLGSNYTGVGTGGCTVDHNLIDEQLTVFYSTNGGSSWTEAEYLPRATLLGYQTYGARMIDLSSITACANTADFALRFRWQLNRDTDTADLDNIVVTGTALGPPDTTAPGPIVSFIATKGNGQNTLSWAKPNAIDFAGTKIMSKTTGYPSGPTDGVQCYNSTGTGFIHTGLTNGVTYYYSAYAFDEVPNYSTAAQANATPADTTPPANVSGFAATAGDEQVSLAWTNPSTSDFTGTMIRYKTTGYPTSATDGTLVVDKPNTPSSADSYTHTGLTNGLTYYYRAFAHDVVPNYASGTTSSATPVDLVAPGPVTSLAVVVGDQCNNLMWIPSPDADFGGVKIRFKTTGYPTSISDGTECFDGLALNYTHTGLTNGVNYYYSVFAYDDVPNYSTKADASGMPVHVEAKDAKLAPNNTILTLTAGVISATFPDFFYVQNPDSDRPLFGIRVNKAGHGLAEGHMVGAHGIALTDEITGEKQLSATWAGTSVTAAVTAKSMSNAAIGGVDWNYNDSNKAGQKGVEGAIGPDNIGLLVRVWGKVTQRQTTGPNKYFYINDGSNVSDGTDTGDIPNIGLRISADPTGYETDEYVVVTGISSVFKDGAGDLRRLILPKMIQEL